MHVPQTVPRFVSRNNKHRQSTPSTQFVTMPAATFLLCLLSLCLVATCIEDDHYPLWHVRKWNGRCSCGKTYNGVIRCDRESLYVLQGNCLTWNNLTGTAELHACLFSTLWDFQDTCVNNVAYDSYRISINISDDSLNYVTCHGYNRKGIHCRQCLDGYGPAAFYDGVSCAEC